MNTRYVNNDSGLPEGCYFIKDKFWLKRKKYLKL